MIFNGFFFVSPEEKIVEIILLGQRVPHFLAGPGEDIREKVMTEECLERMYKRYEIIGISSQFWGILAMLKSSPHKLPNILRLEGNLRDSLNKKYKLSYIKKFSDVLRAKILQENFLKCHRICPLGTQSCRWTNIPLGPSKKKGKMKI